MIRFSLALLAAGLASSLTASHAQPRVTMPVVECGKPVDRAGEGAIGKESDAAWVKFRSVWTQSREAFRTQWERLTADDIREIDGRRDLLIGKIEDRYGVTCREAERQVDGFENSQ